MQTFQVPLYAIRHSQIGGTEFWIYNLLRGIVGAGARVGMHYGRDADLSQDFLTWARAADRVELHREGGLPGSKNVRFAEELLYQQRRRDDDWALFPNYFCPPAMLSKRRKSAVILYDIQYRCLPKYHSKKRRQWLDFYLPKMFETADSVILISNSELALVREHFGAEAAARCTVVHSPIDFGRLEQPATRASETVREMVKHQYILSVCHQFPHKNVVTLLKAFEKVAMGDPSLKLYMVGSASEANLAFIRDSLSASVRDRVHITGFVSDAELGQFYANARLFVLPSLYEGFGMPAVEALGLGVPTLVSNAFALPEVTLGYAGLIDKPRDVGAWAASIEALLAADTRPTAEQVSHIRSTYSPTTTGKELLAILRP
jgi:glycosyltransferase involved in cell wall biosynthesis